MSENRERARNGRKSAAVFWLVSILVLAAIIVVLGFRNDHEIIQTTPDGAASFDVASPAHLSLFVCLPEAQSSQIPASLSFSSANPRVALSTLTQPGVSAATRGASLNVELISARKLKISSYISNTYNVSSDQACGVSPMISVRNEASEISQIAVEAPKGALLAAAVSPAHHVAFHIALFVAFFLSIWGAFALSLRKNTPKMPTFSRYDGFVGFVLSLFVSYGLSLGVYHFAPENTHFFPSYGSVFVLLATNFISFISVFFLFYVIRLKFPSAQHSKKELKSDINDIKPIKNERSHPFVTKISNLLLPEQGEKKAHYPIEAAVSGVVLVLIALMVTSQAPLPGLSGSEMASQLTSSILLLGTAALLAAISEECMFRGLIQSSLEARPDSRYPALENGIAILCSSLLFVLVHVPQSAEHLWALIPIGLFALTAGWLKLRSGSIFTSVLLHMTYNGLLVMPSIIVLLF